MICQISYQAMVPDKLSLNGRQVPHQQLEESGLAHSVGAHNSNTR